jgi:hypothetical protein
MMLRMYGTAITLKLGDPCSKEDAMNVAMENVSFEIN